MNRLVRNLDEFRCEKKITQQSLAYILGVAFSTVNRWLNNKTQPSRIQEFHIKKLLKNYGRSES
ncbi:MAG TPA: XRE family transcriptional regulator [bacterium]|nr:XRE family transcriptional regulator [bacterium]